MPEKQKVRDGYILYKVANQTQDISNWIDKINVGGKMTDVVTNSKEQTKNTF
jgi:hypothetical protein